jgi:hypothetical protein
MLSQPKGQTAVVRSLEKLGKHSLARAVHSGLDEYRRTAGGRVVLFKFGGTGDAPLKSIYLDHVSDTLAAASMSTAPVYRVVAMKKAAGPRKKAAKKRVGRQPSPEEVASKIPKPVREFCIYFLINIQKLICPTGKGKVVLGGATTGLVAALTNWLAETFGLTDQMARAFATTVVITIFTATKGSFCDMTAAMAKTALKKG